MPHRISGGRSHCLELAFVEPRSRHQTCPLAEPFQMPSRYTEAKVPGGDINVDTGETSSSGVDVCLPLSVFFFKERSSRHIPSRPLFAERDLRKVPRGMFSMECSVRDVVSNTLARRMSAKEPSRDGVQKVQRRFPRCQTIGCGFPWRTLGVCRVSFVLITPPGRRLRRGHACLSITSRWRAQT